MSSNSSPREFQAFLSYAHGDDEVFVSALYQYLVRAGVHVWWDRVSMQSRMLPFLQEIQKGIVANGRVIALITPKALISNYTRYEWQIASLFSSGIIPVLRDGSPDDIPSELHSDESLFETVPLNQYHFVDARGARPLEETVAELVGLLRTPVAPLAAISTRIPALPLHFRPPLALLDHARQRLLADIISPVPPRPETTAVVFVGMGGIGKSVAASAVVRQAAVRRAFTHIGWVRVGQTATASAVEAATSELLGVEPPGLEALLGQERVLLVLDDVWQIEPIQGLLNALGPTCRVLATTRDRILGTTLTGVPNVLDVQLPTRDDALAILNGWSGQTLDRWSQAEIVSECGALPLAVALCGAMAANGVPGDDILSALRTSHIEEIEALAPLPNVNEQQLFRVMHRSVDALGSTENSKAHRYLELAAFRGEDPVPVAAVLRLWHHTGGLSHQKGRRLLAELCGRCLLTVVTDDSPTRESRVGLHDLQRDYLRHVCRDTTKLDAIVVGAYERAEDWPTLEPDGYIHLHLLEHLRGAGRTQNASELLLNAQWLEAKLRNTNIWALVADFEGPDGEGRALAIREALRRSAAHLAARKDELIAQLRARIDTATDPVLHGMLVTDYTPTKPALVPASPSLTTPSGLIATFGKTDEPAWIGLLGNRSEFAVAIGRHVTIRSTVTGTVCCTLDVARPILAATCCGDGSRIASATELAIQIWHVSSGALELEFGVGTRPLALAFCRGDAELNVLFEGFAARFAAATGDQIFRVDMKMLDAHTSPAISERWVAMETKEKEDHQSAVVVRSLSDGADVFRSGSTLLEYAMTPQLATDERNVYFSRSVLQNNVGEVFCGDIAAGISTCLLRAAGRKFKRVAVDGNLGHVLTYSENGLELWRTDSAPALPTEYLKSAVSGDGRVSAVCDTRQVMIRRGGETATLVPAGPEAFEVDRVSLNHDGSVCVLGECRNRLSVVSVWEAREVRHLTSFHVGDFQRCLSCLVVSRAGDKVLTCTYGAQYVFANVEDRNGSMITLTLFSADGSWRQQWKGHEDRVISASFGLEDSLVYTASDDRTLRQWKTNDGAPGWTIQLESSPERVVVSADGQRVACLLFNHNVVVYDTVSAQQVASISAHESKCLALDAAGTIVFTGAWTGQVAAWNVDDGRCVASFTLDADVVDVGVSGTNVVCALDSAGRQYHLQLIGAGGPLST